MLEVKELPLRPIKVRATAWRERCGGPASTAAVAVASLGVASSLWARVGTDTEGADFLEVWLMNRAGTQIVALGALTRDGGSWDGSFTVPANLPMGQLTVVDVSAERWDGNAGHSGVSLLRGSVS